MNDIEQTDDATGDVFAETPLSTMANYVREILADIYESVVATNDEVLVRVNSQDITSVLTKLRDDNHAAFTQLSDLTAVDYPERPVRFEMVYQLLSISNNMRLRILAGVAEGQSVPSVSGVFSAANWAEREAWDMFGIFFAGHPDLRRLLTDYGFEGHPLRKDFPLTGHVEVRYDDTQRRVVNEPVHLVQEFRDFDFLSPWEGMQHAIDAADSDKNSDSN
ncbi:NADH-quinone oxidoreductase subunit C [Candidatus Puniceispirillum marinum]|uniref:NADH-quinone oxidoreductase subunit C n=1 Tax=Puniceispirillum marinum (strain IMCC1322) TaxID=488538 RepID=D5BPA4_PUNMI|nr:NADH-quinone oxidoreductase subunit C [Candidatus Puniceispirillum marinum]ADE38386.1 NADH (or F420H2) dehydrogenase, subunit C [Candidatus Puniceispirillum marinum IMCC1322]